MITRTLPQHYFENLYTADPDPWRFASSDYERDKYFRTLEALGHYGRALEVGCSIGVFTQSLAARCDHLLAIDIAAAPILHARRRCRDLSNVQFSQMGAPGEWPSGAFDLILLSEVVYYLDEADVGRLAERVKTSLARGGDLMLVHWTGPTNYPLSGDAASDILLDRIGEFARVVRQERFEKFRLDLARRD